MQEMVEFCDDRKKGKLYSGFFFFYSQTKIRPRRRCTYVRSSTSTALTGYVSRVRQQRMERSGEKKTNQRNEVKRVAWERRMALAAGVTFWPFLYILVSNVMNSTRKHLENSFGTTTTPAIWSLRLSNKWNGSCCAFFIEFVSLEFEFWIYIRRRQQNKLKAVKSRGHWPRLRTMMIVSIDLTIRKCYTLIHSRLLKQRNASKTTVSGAGIAWKLSVAVCLME